MSPLPSDPTARQRLREAQRQEADALKAVELAARTRDRVQRKLDSTEAELLVAKQSLVSVSGLARAALLLGEDESAVRRFVRAAQPSSSSAADAGGSHAG
jgi:hypothetical protein